MLCYKKEEVFLMNFNVYLPKKIGEQLDKAISVLHCSRNSIITEALRDWLGKHLAAEWPSGFFDFQPLENVPDFKALRKDLANNVKEDPLA